MNDRDHSFALRCNGEMNTHMRHHHFPNHHHQIIHANPSPLPPPTSHTRRALSPLAQLNPDLPRTLQEKPQEIALLQPHLPSSQHFRFKEDERQYELSVAHRFICCEVLFPERLLQRGFPSESRFGLRFGLYSNRARRFQTLLDERRCGTAVFFIFLRCGRCQSRLFEFNA